MSSAEKLGFSSLLVVLMLSAIKIVLENKKRKNCIDFMCSEFLNILHVFWEYNQESNDIKNSSIIHSEQRGMIPPSKVSQPPFPSLTPFLAQTNIDNHSF